MKALFTVVVVTTASAAISMDVSSGMDSATMLSFDDWMTLHGKTYNDHEEQQRQQQTMERNDEYWYRRNIYESNAQLVLLHNQAYKQGYTTYAMTLNSPFADMTADEFQDAYLMEGQNCSATHISSGSIHGSLYSGSSSNNNNYYLEEKLPEFVDWRTRGIITPIKNQKQCGSCWTFSTSGTLEAHTCLHNAQPDSVKDCTQWTGLAEQQLLDCAFAYDNHGCNGGLPSHAFAYLKDAGGMDSEDSYPYRANDNGGAQDGCAASSSAVAAQVAEVFNITAYDEEDLVAAIAHIGPVSIAYQVSPDFRLYSHGVYDSWDATTNQTVCKSSPQDVNHAVVAVGYGSTEPATEEEPSVPYYIVRNSWSSTWGMEGYFWMKRDQNLCGVSDCASFPIVPAAMDKFRTIMKNIAGKDSKPQSLVSLNDSNSFLRESRQKK